MTEKFLEFHTVIVIGDDRLIYRSFMFSEAAKSWPFYWGFPLRAIKSCGQKWKCWWAKIVMVNLVYEGNDLDCYRKRVSHKKWTEKFWVKDLNLWNYCFTLKRKKNFPWEMKQTVIKSFWMIVRLSGFLLCLKFFYMLL